MLLPLALDKVILTVTVNVTPAFTVNVAKVALVLLKVIELIVALAITVILWPGRIITSSVEIGAIPPTHVAPLFQSPVPELVIVAAKADPDIRKSNNARITPPFRILSKANFLGYFKLRTLTKNIGKQIL